MDDKIYFLGHDGVDKQHKVLFALFDRCKETIENNNPATVEIVVRDLIKYAVEHFRYEEEMMMHMGYPKDKYEEHVVQHLLFKAKMLEIIKRVDNYRSAELAEYMRLWFLKHVLVTDQKFVDYYNSV